MNASTSAAVALSPDPAEEILLRIRRLSSLSAAGLEAVDVGDGEALTRILEERESITHEVTQLIRSLDEQRRHGTTHHRAGRAGTTRLKEIHDAGVRLGTADARLTLAVAAQRDQIARDLEALEHGGAARSAYGQKRRGNAKINIVR